MSLLVTLLLVWLRPVLAQAPKPDRASLLQADRAVSDSSGRRGLRVALRGAIAEDAVLLYSGAPVVQGGSAITALLSAQPLLDSLRVEWQPLHAEVSRDGSLGFTYGVLVTVARGPDAPLRLGKYLAVWRWSPGSGWRVAACAQLGLTPPERVVLPGGIGPLELPRLAPNGPAAAFIHADLDFAALEARSTPAVAFRTYASADAVTFPGTGELNRGPAAIGAAFAGMPPQDWIWYPVVAGAAGSGDLGFTVGLSVRRPRSGGDPTYTKYLTLWRRDTGGTVRYLADGGNSRPAPP